MHTHMHFAVITNVSFEIFDRSAAHAAAPFAAGATVLPSALRCSPTIGVCTSVTIGVNWHGSELLELIVTQRFLQQRANKRLIADHGALATGPPPPSAAVSSGQKPFVRSSDAGH